MTRHVGIIGVSAEGAALCYRVLCAGGATMLGPLGHPELTMHTYSLADCMRLIAAGRWDEVAVMLLSSAEKLRRAGVGLHVCPDNTVHRAVDLVRDRDGEGARATAVAGRTTSAIERERRPWRHAQRKAPS